MEKLEKARPQYLYTQAVFFFHLDLIFPGQKEQKEVFASNELQRN